MSLHLRGAVNLTLLALMCSMLLTKADRQNITLGGTAKLSFSTSPKNILLFQPELRKIGVVLPDTSMEDEKLFADKEVRFLLYSSLRSIFRPFKFEILEYGNNTSLTTSSFDPSLPLRILVHGYGGAFLTTFPQNLKNAYLTASGDERKYNILVVDWTSLSNVWYFEAVINAVQVGRRLGEFICWLQNEHMIDLRLTHMIGLSLGVGVMGSAGATVKETCKKTIGRITGLDPTRLGYEPLFPGARGLGPEDADYVDVIHTNSGPLGYGVMGPMGHADFYVNGGRRQPECFRLHATCSHVIAGFYYADTILTTDEVDRCACDSLSVYRAGPSCCDRRVIFGEYSPPWTRGIFYINYTLLTD